MSDEQRTRFAQLQKLARKRGGRLLSNSYVNTNTHLRWRCAEGHEWDAVPASIRRGSWCGRCAGVSPLTLDDLHAIAREHGGECLATTYVNLKEPVLWRCAKGHEWTAEARHMRSTTSWCPRCAGRKTLEDLEALAAARGGRLLSKEALGAHAKHRWQCKMGHVFEAVGEHPHGTTGSEIRQPHGTTRSPGSWDHPRSGMI